ncbi:MAG: hypothetical protein IJH12_04800 [Clostridia bacterium]|nr:hypothetical protein [Clostridia bacterium]
MLINTDRNPKYSLFYVGFEILNYIKKGKNGVSIDEIYRLIQSKVDSDINITYVYYTLDWLFMMSTIKIEEERVFICY